MPATSIRAFAFGAIVAVATGSLIADAQTSGQKNRTPSPCKYLSRPVVFAGTNVEKLLDEMNDHLIDIIYQTCVTNEELGELTLAIYDRPQGRR